MRKFFSDLATPLVAMGPVGLFGLALLDSIGVPIVGAVDALLVVVANQNPGIAYVSAVMAVLGSLLGSMILFFLARKGGKAYLKKVTSGERGTKFRHWFQSYGLVTVFIPAISVIPMPLKAFVACSGALGVAPLRFGLTILAARVPRYLLLAWLGQQMGSNALGWISEHKLHFALGLGVLGLTLFLLIRIAEQRELRLATAQE